MKSTRRVGLIGLALLGVACGDGTYEPSADGGACPAHIAGNTTWIYQGEDERCQELADAVNDAAEADDDDSDQACNAAATSMTDDGRSCRANATVSCKAVQAQLSCAVSQSGDADCSAQVDVNVQSGQLSCELLVEFRSS